MQQLPNLPTDSLYKFLSLAGITLFVFSFTYPQIRQSEINLRLINIEAEKSALDVEKTRLDEEYSSLKLESKNFEKERKDLEDQDSTTQADIDEFNEKASFMREKLAKTLQKEDEIKIKEIKIDSKQEEVNYLKKEIAIYEKFFINGMAAGFSLFLTGAVLWFFFVQHPQDLLLDYEQKNKEQEFLKNAFEYKEKRQEYSRKIKEAKRINRIKE